MLWTLFWTLTGGVALVVALWAFTRWTQRQDFELGARAYMDGLPLNSGWSRRMQDGWGHAWRACHGENDLTEELLKMMP